MASDGELSPLLRTKAYTPDWAGEMMLTTITVEQRHIDAGVAFRCWECPLALAIRELITIHADTEVGSIYCRFGGKIEVEMPEEARYFVREFDAGATDLKPFSFQLDIPSDLLKSN